MTQFDNRQQAGRRLAEKLAALQREGSLDLSKAVVIALPRGGVPVGFEIAKALHLPLDVCVVRKVGAPMQPELAVAAVAEGGGIAVNENVRQSLGLSSEELEQLAAPKRAEIASRVKKFRGDKAALDVSGKTVILVDDGLATGATALAAVHLYKTSKAATIVLAVPVCPHGAVARFSAEVDRFITLMSPDDFYAVGQWYRDFEQVSDEEVQALLQDAPHIRGNKPA